MIGRLTTHTILAAVTVAAYFMTPRLITITEDPFHQFSLSLAYTSLSFLFLSFLIGPYRVIFGYPNPIHSDLRRDIGIWAGLTALAHVVLGLQIHFKGRMQLYFLFPSDADTISLIRYDPFGLANYTGAMATIGLVTLLMLSNNYSLRTLKTLKWKSWQRMNYLVVALVIPHTIIYQFLEKRSFLWFVGVTASTMLLVLFQFFGYKRYCANKAEKDLLRTNSINLMR